MIDNRSPSEDRRDFSNIARWAILESTVDDGTRRPRIWKVVPVILPILKFRRRCVDQSANCVPQMFFSLKISTRVRPGMV